MFPGTGHPQFVPMSHQPHWEKIIFLSSNKTGSAEHSVHIFPLGPSKSCSAAVRPPRLPHLAVAPFPEAAFLQESLWLFCPCCPRLKSPLHLHSSSSPCFHNHAITAHLHWAARELNTEMPPQINSKASPQYCFVLDFWTLLEENIICG